MDPLTLGALAVGGQALGGLVGGYFQGESVKDAARAERAMQERALAEARRSGDEAIGYLQPYEQIGRQSLGQLVENIDSGAYRTPVGEFDYSRGVGEFLDPSMAYQQQRAGEALEQSALAGGGLQSGATLKALQEQAMQMAQTDYGNAHNRMMQDKSFAYGQFMDKFNRQRMENQSAYQRLAGLGQMGTGMAQSMANARIGEGTQAIDIMGQMGQSNAALQSANASMFGNMANTLGDAGASYLGMRALQPQQPQSPYNPADLQRASMQDASAMQGYQPAQGTMSGQAMQGYQPFVGEGL